MSRRLGGIDLPQSILWTDQYKWSPVAQSSTRTVCGVEVTWYAPLRGGRPVTLEIQENVSWAEGSFMSAINALAAQPGATLLFEWDEASLTVMFRHEEPPAVAFDPLWPGHHLHTGTIKLKQV